MTFQLNDINRTDVLPQEVSLYRAVQHAQRTQDAGGELLSLAGPRATDGAWWLQVARRARDWSLSLAALACLQRAAQYSPDDPNVWAECGQLQLSLRQFDEARRSFERLRQIPAQAAGGWLGLAQVSLTQGDRAAAQGLALLALDARSDYAPAMRLLGVLVNGESVAAKECWFNWLAKRATPTTDGLVHVLVVWLTPTPRDGGVVNLALQAFPQILERPTLSDDARIKAHSTYAMLLNSQRRFAEAETHAAIAGKALQDANYHLAEACFEQGKPDASGFYDFTPLWSGQQTSPNLVHSPLGDLSAQCERRGPLLFLSLDGVYLRRFGAAEILSLHETSPGIDVHLHCVNPTEDTASLVARLQQACTTRRITLSTEQRKLDDAFSRGVYFCNMRFVRAMELHAATGREVVITDADIIIRHDLNRLLTQAASHDVALVEYLEQPFCNRYGAALVVLKPTPLAGEFARRLAFFVQHNMQRKPTWFMDQVGLYALARTMQRESADGLRLLVWPERTVSTDWRDDDPIWNAAADRKYTNNPYTLAKQALLARYALTGIDR